MSTLRWFRRSSQPTTLRHHILDALLASYNHPISLIMEIWQVRSHGVYCSTTSLYLYARTLTDLRSSLESVSSIDVGSPDHRRKMMHCMCVCSLYALVSSVAIVFEVYALLAMQFCEGEDLMAMFWSSWMVLQVGSEVAILGILLAVYHTMRGHKHP